ncbi:hypothetical protein COLINT_02842 [Collinsella intestinalis DSM 13280]|uniref:Uncharacterized protein n=1 Tax=Collinsella intestinalis DSM 13280 TaxID=521003 RepID=C4F9V8_9ACTN|nr:hypothetical protein COLINT_02842 [Collinsella intestinalis DSM 13280]
MHVRIYGDICACRCMGTVVIVVVGDVIATPPTSTKIAYGNLPLGIDQTACKHRQSQSCHRQSGHRHG